MNHHLYLLLKGTKECPAKPDAPILSDTKAAPLLAQIILEGRETGLQFLYAFQAGAQNSAELKKLTDYLTSRGVYVVVNTYRTRSVMVLYFTQENLDRKFKEICPEYQSPLPRRSSCCIV